MAEILLKDGMLYVRTLTPAECRVLQQLQRRGILQLAHRARIVLLSSSDWSVAAIAEAVNCCRRAVRAWIHVFQQGGLAQLAGKMLGRPPHQEADISAMTFQDDICQPSEQRLVPAIELTVPETRRLLSELVWNKRRCPAFVLYWSAYRRYKQALAKRSHYRKRGAEPPIFQQVRL